MADTQKEFTPLDGESSIYLQQISTTNVADVANERLLSISVPPDEIDVLIGLLEGSRHALTTNTAYFIVVGSSLLIALFCLMIFWKIFRGEIDIGLIISEANGKASLSRVQALIFTLLLSGSILAIVVETGGLPNDIPNEILWIMGGSFGTYLASKGIQTAGGPSFPQFSGARTDERTNSGPLLRFGTGTPFEIDPNAYPTAGGDYQVNVPVSSEKNNRSVLVAVAVGQTRLRISSAFAADQIDRAKLRFIDKNGVETFIDLSGEAEITTQAETLTEVRVSFQPKTSKLVVVPVRVQEIA